MMVSHYLKIRLSHIPYILLFFYTLMGHANDTFLWLQLKSRRKWIPIVLMHNAQMALKYVFVNIYTLAESIFWTMGMQCLAITKYSTKWFRRGSYTKLTHSYTAQLRPCSIIGREGGGGGVMHMALPVRQKTLLYRKKMFRLPKVRGTTHSGRHQ